MQGGNRYLPHTCQQPALPAVKLLATYFPGVHPTGAPNCPMHNCPMHNHPMLVPCPMQPTCGARCTAVPLCTAVPPCRPVAAWPLATICYSAISMAAVCSMPRIAAQAPSTGA